MKTFLLEIITPEKVAFTDAVDMVNVPSATGTLGILSRHVPLFAKLVEGELKIKRGNEEYFLAIGGGFVEITHDKVMILVTRAVHANQLNEQEIEKAKKAALEVLKQKPSQEAIQTANVLYRQSLVDMQILRRRRKRRHIS